MDEDAEGETAENETADKAMREAGAEVKAGVVGRRIRPHFIVQSSDSEDQDVEVLEELAPAIEDEAERHGGSGGSGEWTSLRQLRFRKKALDELGRG